MVSHNFVGTYSNINAAYNKINGAYSNINAAYSNVIKTFVLRLIVFRFVVIFVI